MLDKKFIDDTFKTIIDLCKAEDIPYKVINWQNGDINGIRVNGSWYLYTCDENGYEYSDKPTHFLEHYVDDDVIINNIIDPGDVECIIKYAFMENVDENKAYEI